MSCENLIAKCFEDYQLIDSGQGNKLETVSGIKMVRPSPQAIWNKSVPQRQWQAATSKVIRKKDGGGVWEHGSGDPTPFNLKWKSDKGASFEFKLKLTSFGHCGIFFEQSSIWNEIESQLSLSHKKQPTFLNLFGYTGAASIVAAKCGANVVHVDSSKGVLDWGRQNCELNKIGSDRIKWFQSDVMKFLENAIKRNEKFDGVLADPPSWGHGAKKEVWEFDKHICELVEAVKQVSLEKNFFFILTTHTHGVQHFALKNLISRNFKSGIVSSGDMAIKHANDERLLPAGIYAKLLM